MKPRKVRVPASLVLPIVGDGAIAGHVADGRLLPLLILDTTERPEVAELIRVHAHLPAGDARSRWAVWLDSDDHVMLLLTFVQPMDVEVMLLFSISTQAILVEAILSGGAVYLQAGVAGDRLATTMDAHRVMVEVPDTGFGQEWERVLLNRMTTVLSKRLGVSQRKARPTAESVISEMRNLAGFRMPARGR